MNYEADIKRFIATVIREADEHPNFIREHMRESVIYKLLDSRYDNVEDLLEMAIKKADIYERARDLAISRWKRWINFKADPSANDEWKVGFLIFNIQTHANTNPRALDTYDRFIQRHSMDELKKICLEVVQKYPYDGSLYGKFREELYSNDNRESVG